MTRFPLVILFALAGCGLLPDAHAPGLAGSSPRAARTAELPTRFPGQPTATQPARAEMDLRPIGVVALSDALEVSADNPDGFQYWAIAKGPKPTLGGNVVAFGEGAGDIARAYPCRTLIVWTGFGGSGSDKESGYVPDVLDAAQGVTLADIGAFAKALRDRGVRPGIIVRPQTSVRGVNRVKVDGSNPVGTLLWQIACAKSNGFIDFYVDTLCGETFEVLDPDRFAQVVERYPDSLFLVEFWHPGYARFPNVIHWRGSAQTFTDDRPQAVALKADDVKSPAMQKAWGKRLRDTGSTVLLNCRPDDPTLPQRQAGVVKAWKESQQGPATQPTSRPVGK